MGANLSNPFDEASRERVQEIITEVLTTFNVEFLKSYKARPTPRRAPPPTCASCRDARPGTRAQLLLPLSFSRARRRSVNDGDAQVLVFENAKEEAIGKAANTGRNRTKSFHISAGEGEYKLVPPPPATSVIKVGTLTKRGDFKKNWLKRWFVALNEANNFDIVYYDTEPNMADFEPNSDGNVEPPKGKGAVKLAGYTVQMLEDGEVGFKLEGNESQRPWLLRADSTEDVVAWTPVFQRACKEAQPPCDPDPLVHGAFMEAYKATRWSQRLWGSWSAWGAEEDMLGALVNEVVNKRVMYDVYHVRPRARRRGRARAHEGAPCGGEREARARTEWHTRGTRPPLACLAVAGAHAPTVRTHAPATRTHSAALAIGPPVERGPCRRRPRPAHSCGSWWDVRRRWWRQSIPSGPARSTMVGIVKKTVGGMVRAATSAGWKSAVESVKVQPSGCIDPTRASNSVPLPPPSPNRHPVAIQSPPNRRPTAAQSAQRAWPLLCG